MASCRGSSPYFRLLKWCGMASSLFFSWLTEDETTREGFSKAFSSGIWWGQKLGSVLAATFTTVAQSIGIVVNSIATVGTLIQALATGKILRDRRHPEAVRQRHGGGGTHDRKLMGCRWQSS